MIVLLLLNLAACIINGIQGAYYFGQDDVGRSLPYLGLSFFNLIVYVWIKNKMVSVPPKE